MISSLSHVVLYALFSLPVFANQHDLPRNARSHRRQQNERELDELLLPITATTTVVVQMTRTETVWVQPTDQAAFQPSPAPSSSSSDTTSVGETLSLLPSSSSMTESSSTSSFVAGPSAASSSSFRVEDIMSTVSSSSYASAESTGSAVLSELAESSSTVRITESSILFAPPSSFVSATAMTSTTTVSQSESNAPSPIRESGSGAPRSSQATSALAVESAVAADRASSSASASTSSSGSAFSTKPTSSPEPPSSTASPSTESSSAILSTETFASAASSNAPSPSRASGSGEPRPSPTASSSIAADAVSAESSTSNAPSLSRESGPGAPRSTSLSTSNAPSPSRESGSGAPRSTSSSTSNAPSPIRGSGSGDPRPSPTTTSMSSSSSAAESSTTSEAEASSSSSITSSAASSAITSSAALSSSTSELASSTSSAAETASTLGILGKTLMNAYYPDWSGWSLPPESVDWSRFDVIDFAFALPTASFGLEFTQYDSSSLLTRLVATAHAAGKRVKLSIGGWTGSKYFSTICASDANRQTFISNILAVYCTYELDGIDIDWEYPGVSGAGGNVVDWADSANFLLLLTELRAALPDGALISAATQVWPFAGSDGRPMSDVSGFAKVLDWILIMNYDIWGSSSIPGANAPLSDACGNSTQPMANAYAAVSSWTTAGMPAEKITLGVPAYGYIQMSAVSSLKNRRSLSAPPHKRPVPHAGTDHTRRASVTIYNGNGGSSDGQVMFESLISQGALAADGAGGFVGSGGFTRQWDGCSSTPWLKSSHSGQVITYDDPQSMSLKGQFAVQAGLRGCNVFSIDGDWTGYSWPLTDAVRSGLGL